MAQEFLLRRKYTTILKNVLEKVSRLTIGDPLNENTKVGALVSKRHMNKVLDHIRIAKEEGGTLLSGGSQYFPEGRCKEGYFIRPTVFEGLPYNCATNQEEIFGPVVTLTPFNNEEELIQYANSTKCLSQHMDKYR